MQLLDLPLAIGFGVPADAGIEGARRVLLKWTPFWGPRAKLEIGRSVW